MVWESHRFGALLGNFLDEPLSKYTPVYILIDIHWTAISNQVDLEVVIGADYHNVEGNQGEVGANLHSAAQISL